MAFVRYIQLKAMQKLFLLFLFILLPFSVNSQCTNTTWDGSTWTNGFPDSTKNAIIDGVYDTANEGSIDCCSLYIINQGYLTVNVGDYCNVYLDITVDSGSILLVKSGGSLIPNHIDAVSSGIVDIERKTPSTKRFDYTYWSSPVSTTIGAALLPTKWEPNMTFTFNTPNFYDVETVYMSTFISNVPDGQDDNQDTWTRTNIANSMIPGKGYASMIKSLVATGVYPRIETVIFSGHLNTGVINIPLQLSQNTATDFDDYNLVGNPYSSSINSNDLIDANISNISGTLYFWTHANTMSTSYSGLAQFNFSANDYAKYTKLGGINAVFGGKKPSNVIGSCQGFLVEAESTNNLVFTPTLMSKAYVNTTAVSFFRGSNNRKRNLWLNMTDDNLFSQQLIGYNSSSDVDYNKGWDSKIININVPLKFYSIEEGTKYDIQARGRFDDEDIVNLGYFSAVNGQFTISIDQKEGKIENVYLFDRSFGTWHDLTEPYVFSTIPGEFNTRFFIQYESPEDEDDHDDHDDKMMNNLVKRIDVYDLFNRKIDSINGDNLDSLPKNQILILKIYQNGEIITKKIIL
jgi:hypothetical protein